MLPRQRQREREIVRDSRRRQRQHHRHSDRQAGGAAHAGSIAAGQGNPEPQSRTDARRGAGAVHLDLPLERELRHMKITASNRQRLLVIGSIAAIALLLGDRVVLTPLTNAWKTRTTEIAKLQKNVT